jgi:Tol biopolymer transport system component
LAKGTHDGGDIFSILPNGADLKDLTRRGHGIENDPQWSPTDSRIAFDRYVNEKDSQIFHIRRDGSHLSRITDGCCNKAYPTWSPSGRRILWVDGGGFLYMSKTDGSHKHQIKGVYGYAPDWRGP